MASYECKLCGRRLTVKQSVKQEHGPVCISKALRSLTLELLFSKLTHKKKRELTITTKRAAMKAKKVRKPTKGGRHGRRS